MVIIFKLDRSLKLLSLIGKMHRKEQVEYAIYASASEILRYPIPFLLRDLIDKVTVVRAFTEILRLILYTAVLGALTILTQGISEYKNTIIANKAKAWLRKVIALKSLNLREEYFNRHTISEILSRTIYDVEWVAPIGSLLYAFIIVNTLRIAITLFIIFSLNVILSLIVLSILPPYAIALMRFRRKLYEASKMKEKDMKRK